MLASLERLEEGEELAQGQGLQGDSKSPGEMAHERSYTSEPCAGLSERRPPWLQGRDPETLVRKPTQQLDRPHGWVLESCRRKTSP